MQAEGRGFGAERTRQQWQPIRRSFSSSAREGVQLKARGAALRTTTPSAPAVLPTPSRFNAPAASSLCSPWQSLYRCGSARTPHEPVTTRGLSSSVSANSRCRQKPLRWRSSLGPEPGGIMLRGAEGAWEARESWEARNHGRPGIMGGQGIMLRGAEGAWEAREGQASERKGVWEKGRGQGGPSCGVCGQLAPVPVCLCACARVHVCMPRRVPAASRGGAGASPLRQGPQRRQRHHRAQAHHQRRARSRAQQAATA